MMKFCATFRTKSCFPTVISTIGTKHDDHTPLDIIISASSHNCKNLHPHFYLLHSKANNRTSFLAISFRKLCFVHKSKLPKTDSILATGALGIHDGKFSAQLGNAYVISHAVQQKLLHFSIPPLPNCRPRDGFLFRSPASAPGPAGPDPR